jgi:iron complex transport system substrate-binding protein
MRKLLEDIIGVGVVAVGLILLAAAPAAARSLLDQAGRRVELPERPQRIVALAPSVTEIIFALGEAARLIGVTAHCDFPPEAIRLPKVGSYVRLDLERIVGLRPDLCIAVKDGNPKSAIERLEALGVPVFALDPRSVETVIRAILDLGVVLAVEPRAEALTAEMRARIDRITRRAAGEDRRPRVFFQIGTAPIVSVGTHTFAHELIELAGGVNVAAGPAAYPRFSREQVLGLVPDLIVISSMDRAAGAVEEARREWNRWPGIPAVRDGRIHVVDSNLFDRPSPRLVAGLEELARCIHPALFGSVK